ncbi:MAG TPA: YncE family protein [Bryobacteraceae bacterium]|nr:YncE family protein [Bryobacteraceae bacterium]
MRWIKFAIATPVLIAVVLLSGCDINDYFSPEKLVPPPPGGRSEAWMFNGSWFELVYNSLNDLIGAFEFSDSHTFQPLNPFDPLVQTLIDAREKTIISHTLHPNAEQASGRQASSNSHAIVYLLAADGTLAQFDPANKTIVNTTKRLLCTDPPPANIAVATNEFDVTPDGSLAFIAARDSVSNCVIVFDLANWRIANRIPLPSGANDIIPGEIKITPDGTTAYLVGTNNQHGALPTGVLFIIATATHKLTSTIQLPQNFNTNEIAMSPDGLYAYLGSSTGGQSKIPVLDTTTNTIGSYIPVATLDGTGMAVHPDGTRLYLVPFLKYGPITIVDTSTYQARGTIPSQAGSPSDPASPQPGYPDPVFTPDGRYMFVLNAPNAVTAVDTLTEQVVSHAPIPPPPSGPGIPLNPQEYITTFYVPNLAN